MSSSDDEHEPPAMEQLDDDAIASDRVGDQSKAQQELEQLIQSSKEKTDDERNIFKFDDGDSVDYRLPPDTAFADNLEEDENGYKLITWTQLKKKFCFERPAHTFKIIGDISQKDMTQWERSKSIKLRDSDGVEGALFFYDDDARTFAWDDVVVGNTMELKSPRFHRFMDSQEGMRVESNSSIGWVRKRKFTDTMRLDYGKQNKDNGNKFFADKKYENALTAYDTALNHLEGTFFERPDLENEAKELAAACYLNIAAVRIAEKKWNLIEIPCEKALQINASPSLNAKAYFRMGQAFMEQLEWTAAKDKLQRAIALAPGDPRISQELDKLQQMQRDQKEAQRALFSSKGVRNNQKSDFGFRENLLVEAPEGLEGVKNFRDLGGIAVLQPQPQAAVPSPHGWCIKPHLLYRSSNFLDAGKSDIFTLLDPFGIKTIVDLRNDRETKAYLKALLKKKEEAEGDASSFFDYRQKFYQLDVSCSGSTAPFSAKVSVSKAAREMLKANWALVSQRMTAPTVPSTSLPIKGSVEEREVILKHCRVVLCVDLCTRSILSLLTWWRLVVVFVLGALFFIREASRMVVRNTAQRVGPVQLYLAIVDKQRKEMCYLFKEVFAKEESYPLVISCSLGKDRTGVVTALLLSVVGVAQGDIARDYSKTAQCLTAEQKGLNDELGLGPEWSETPESLMLEFLTELSAKYGGVTEYLLLIGVTQDEINRIKAILVGKKRKA